LRLDIPALEHLQGAFDQRHGENEIQRSRTALLLLLLLFALLIAAVVAIARRVVAILRNLPRSPPDPRRDAVVACGGGPDLHLHVRLRRFPFQQHHS